MDDYISELIELQSEKDAEARHIAADRVLCDLLESIGYKKVVEEYNKIDKYYI
jgi:hypothetical protein